MPYVPFTFVTVNVRVPVNCAVAETSAETVNVQVDDVEHPETPDQPVKTDPLGAEAVRVTTVPSRNVAEVDAQPVAHEIPLGLEVTVPTPDCTDDFASATVRVAAGAQLGYLNDMIRVRQGCRTLPLGSVISVAETYSPTYQNVQSSTGSTLIAK